MIDQSAMKTSIGANFIRSTKAPTISAGVIAAKVIWNIMKTVSGMIAEYQGEPAIGLQIEGPAVDARPLSITRPRPPTH